MSASSDRSTMKSVRPIRPISGKGKRALLPKAPHSARQVPGLAAGPCRIPVRGRRRRSGPPAPRAGGVGELRDRIARALGSCGASSVALPEEAVEGGQGGLQAVDLFVGGVAGVSGDEGPAFAFGLSAAADLAGACRRKVGGDGGTLASTRPRKRPRAAASPQPPPPPTAGASSTQGRSPRAGASPSVSRRKTGTAPDRLPASPRPAPPAAAASITPSPTPAIPTITPCGSWTTSASSRPETGAHQLREPDPKSGAPGREFSDRNRPDLKRLWRATQV